MRLTTCTLGQCPFLLARDLTNTPLFVPRTGASTVFAFNHCVRQCSDSTRKGELDSLGRWQVAPSGHAHVDYAGRPADIRGTLAELQFPDDIASRFENDDDNNNDNAAMSRFSLVNAWRPLKTVLRDPLAVADAASVPASDYVIRERKFRPSGVESANYVLAHGSESDQHRWYYMVGPFFRKTIPPFDVVLKLRNISSIPGLWVPEDPLDVVVLSHCEPRPPPPNLLKDILRQSCPYFLSYLEEMINCANKRIAPDAAERDGRVQLS